MDTAYECRDPRLIAMECSPHPAETVLNFRHYYADNALVGPVVCEFVPAQTRVTYLRLQG